MKLTTILVSILFIFQLKLKAQEPAVDLLSELSEENPTENNLLPEKMLFTQRAMWGEKGLYRLVGIAPKTLSPESRAKELKIRRTMFKIHQGIGLATAGAMLAQGIIGTKLYNNYTDNLKDTHEKLATGINIGYATTALMAFTAPPPMVNRQKFDNIKLHKLLSIVHLSGMIGTNVLAHKVADNVKLKPYHRAVAIGTFAAYTAAIVSIKFEFK